MEAPTLPPHLRDEGSVRALVARLDDVRRASKVFLGAIALNALAGLVRVALFIEWLGAESGSEEWRSTALEHRETIWGQYRDATVFLNLTFALWVAAFIVWVKRLRAAARTAASGTSGQPWRDTLVALLAPGLNLVATPRLLRSIERDLDPAQIPEAPPSREEVPAHYREAPLARPHWPAATIVAWWVTLLVLCALPPFIARLPLEPSDTRARWEAVHAGLGLLGLCLLVTTVQRLAARAAALGQRLLRARDAA